VNSICVRKIFTPCLWLLFICVHSSSSSLYLTTTSISLASYRRLTVDMVQFTSYACQYNNMGVRHMQRNNFAVAAQCFRGAMMALTCPTIGLLILKLQGRYTGSGSPHEDFAIRAANEVPLDTPLYAMYDDVQSMDIEPSNQGHLWVRDSLKEMEESFFMYSQGLMIDEMATDAPLEFKLKIFTCVVLFNMASCYHKHSCHGYESLMHAAVVVYYDCAILLEGSHDLANHACCKRIRVILNNNLAQIHLSRCDYPAFQSCLQRVVASTSQGMRSLYNVNNFPMVDIILNTFMSKVSPIACAA
jgi:hypothetical protein